MTGRIGWLDELAIAYKAKQSNVSLLITTDSYRITELMSHQLRENQIKVVWDLALMTVHQDSKPLQIPLTPADFANFLKSSKTPVHVVITNVMLPSMAESITPLLSSICLDDKLFNNGSHVTVISPELSYFPESLLRQCIIIVPPLSTEQERHQLLSKISEETKKIGLTLPNISTFVQLAAGLTLKEIETISLKSIYLHRTLVPEEFSNYKIQLLKTFGLEYIQPKITFDDIGGYDYLKEYIIKRFVEPLKNPHLIENHGLSLPKGIILYGLPGTGKTLFSLSLASATKLPMVKLTPDRLFHGIVGESEKAVRRITKIIEEMLPIVFIDEADQLLINREQLSSTTDSGVTARIVGGLLEWLGDPYRRAFVIAATNYIDRIDAAMLRPGRFDEVVPIFPPDIEARKQILYIHTQVTRKIPLSRDVDFDELAELTNLMTGAEIEKLCVEAAVAAYLNNDSQVQQSHFKTAIDNMEFNYQKRLSDIENMVKKIKSLDNINRFLLRKLQTSQSQSPSDRVTSFITNL